MTKRTLLSTMLVLPLLSAAGLLAPDLAPAAQAAGDPATTAGAGCALPAVPAVFTPPPAEELDAVTEPALRLELLRMAAEDQRARAAG